MGPREKTIRVAYEGNERRVTPHKTIGQMVFDWSGILAVIGIVFAAGSAYANFQSEDKRINLNTDAISKLTGIEQDRAVTDAQLLQEVKDIKEELEQNKEKDQ